MHRINQHVLVSTAPTVACLQSVNRMHQGQRLSGRLVIYQFHHGHMGSWVCITQYVTETCLSHHLKVCCLGQSVPHLPSCVLVTVGSWTLTRPGITSGISDVCPECGVAPHSVEHLFNCQSHLMQLIPVGQPGCDRRLPQPGQLTITDDLLGYHNSNNCVCYTRDVICFFLLDDEELTRLQESLASDILSAPVPSNVPSPSLMPSTQRPPSSLIRFDSLASIQGTIHNNLLCSSLLQRWPKLNIV